MVIISKPLFYEKVGSSVRCKDFIHNWTDDCFKGNLVMTLNYIQGLFYLYLPIYLFKILVSRKKIDKKFVKNIIKGFFHSYSYAFALGTLGWSSFCLTSNFLGRLYYYNISFIPGLVSGLSIFLELPDYRYFNTLLWMSMVVESFFNNAYYFKIINFSPIKETLIFMISSSLLMYLLVNNKSDKIPFNIWFYQPKLPNHCCENNEKNISLHCLRRARDEFVKYFGLGFVLNGARYLAGAVDKIFENPLKVLLKSLLSKSNFQFGLVVGAYAGLFKVMSCILQKYSKTEKSCTAAIAGLVAGLAYHIKPTINILTFAMTTVLQVLCYKFVVVPPFLQKLPLLEILFIICNTILLGNRLVAPPTCPKYYAKMLTIGSNRSLDIMYNDLVKKYFLL